MVLANEQYVVDQNQIVSRFDFPFDLGHRPVPFRLFTDEESFHRPAVPVEGGEGRGNERGHPHPDPSLNFPLPPFGAGEGRVRALRTQRRMVSR